MEETPTEPLDALPEHEPEKSMVLSDEAQYYVQIIAKWGNFLSIVGFVMCSLMVVFGFFAGSFLTRMSTMSSNPMTQSMGSSLGIFYAAFGLLYFFPSLYLFQFSSKAKKAILYANSADITVAFGKLKSCFKFIGILTLVVICLYALIFVGVLIGLGTYSAFRQ